MTEFYYYFDISDGIIGEKYLTPSDINELLNGKREPLTEADIIKTARNLEADLYRFEKSSEGNYTAQTLLYDTEGL